MNQELFVLDDREESHLTALGWQWAYGCFETFLWKDSTVIGLDWHISRLLFGCSELGLTHPEGGFEELRNRVVSVLEQYSDTSLRIRIEAVLDDPDFLIGGRPPFSARYGGRLSLWEPVPPDIEFSVKLITEPPAEIRLCSPGFKTIDYRPRLQLRNSLQRRGIQEGLLASPHGRLVGGLVTNLFVSWDGIRWVTPPVEDGPLTGVTRHIVLHRLAPVQAAEGGVSTDQLGELKSAFVTNSILGVQPISRMFLGNRQWKNLETLPALVVKDAYENIRLPPGEN